MYTVISVDCILANLLQKNESVTVSDLNRVRSSIENEISEVYVDVTGECVVWSLKRWPELFSMKDTVISRKKEWSKDYVDSIFNWRIPNDVRKKLLVILKKAADENHE